MYYTFPYSVEFSPILIPDENLQGIYCYPQSEEVDDIHRAAALALENPIGSDRLENLAKGKKYALIIADDLSKKTPLKQIIPLLCEKIESAGCQKIKVLVAMGAKRPLTPEEKKEKFGAYIFDKYDIINHRNNDHLDLTDMGYTSRGSRFYVNNNLLEADLIIGLAQVSPHRVSGFSGGSELILPGVSGSESIAKINWDSALCPTEKIFGVADNPIRQEMDECAEMVGLSFMVNCVPDPSGKICHIIAGDLKKSFRVACECSEKVYGANFLHKSDITIADAYPKDKDMWQASRALSAAEIMTKPGGIIIFVSPCREGVSPVHKFVSEYGYKSEYETMADFESGKIPTLTAAAHLLKMGRITRDKHICIMAENKIPPFMANRLGFKTAKTVQDALNQALFIKGSGAVISVLKNGGDTLPVHILRDHFKNKINYF